MPKKFQGENSKSAAARARKAEQKAAADAKRQQELEDAYWKDDDKHVARKEQRKVEKEKKRVEQLERKKETQRLLEEEGSSTKPKISKPVMPAKITRAQIEETIKKDNMGQSTEEVKGKQMSHLEMPLEENINRIVPEEGQVDARTIEDAIAALRTLLRSREQQHGYEEQTLVSNQPTNSLVLPKSRMQQARAG
ncbi:coiled-coil domain-containing protein 124-A-like isoform X2 [Heterodontus francisci]|uniref:coiled-coil domain-containing protein 124-A-like isoform X2 n=1 Tax=Heterodontus francisci TaxID=7792 RepID=UPI00355B9483